jgi:hypothetical protein
LYASFSGVASLLDLGAFTNPPEMRLFRGIPDLAAGNGRWPRMMTGTGGMQIFMIILSVTL